VAKYPSVLANGGTQPQPGVGFVAVSKQARLRRLDGQRDGQGDEQEYPGNRRPWPDASMPSPCGDCDQDWYGRGHEPDK